MTGERLPYEGTEGLKSTGRPVNRADLKPGDIIVITGKTPHVIMFLNWAPNGQIQCIHETGSADNVTVGVMTANLAILQESAGLNKLKCLSEQTSRLSWRSVTDIGQKLFLPALDSDNRSVGLLQRDCRRLFYAATCLSEGC